jgi:hypothetical protein
LFEENFLICHNFGKDSYCTGWLCMLKLININITQVRRVTGGLAGLNGIAGLNGLVIQINLSSLF